MKNKQLEEAVKYCKENICKGYKALSALNLQDCLDARTVNKYLEEVVIGGGSQQRILTDAEERSLV